MTSVSLRLWSLYEFSSSSRKTSKPVIFACVGVSRVPRESVSAMWSMVPFLYCIVNWYRWSLMGMR